MTHGKPCVTKHAKANACVTHGKPCVHMIANGHIYNMGGDQFIEEGRSRKEKRRKKKRERKESKKERERKRGKRKSAFRQSKLVGPKSKVHIFDEGYTPRGRDSSYFGLFSTIRIVGLCLCPKGLFGRISKYGNATLFLSYTLARF